jgi:ribosomal protein L10
MPLTRQDKQKAISMYAKHAKDAQNVVLVAQKGATVNEINDLRKDMVATGGTMQVVKKRLFLRAAKDAGLESPEVGTLSGNVFALYAKWTDEYAPLKAIHTMNKKLKKAKREYKFTYVGGWYETHGKMVHM